MRSIESDGRIEEKLTQGKDKLTHSSPCGDEIDLVQDINEMLVCILLPEVLDNRLTPGTKRIPGVQNMNDDIGRIEDLVQFSPYTTGSTFGVDRFSVGGGGGVVCVRWVNVVFYHSQHSTIMWNEETYDLPWPRWRLGRIHRVRQNFRH